MPREKLEKLPTHRLLALFRRLRTEYYASMLDYDYEQTNPPHPPLAELRAKLKAILKDRPHVPRRKTRCRRGRHSGEF